MRIELARLYARTRNRKRHDTLTPGTNGSARNGQNATQNAPLGSNSQQGERGAGIEADGLSYGDIADELERMLDG